MNNILFDFDEEINLYELLEIDSNSSNKEIKKAWKKLALKYHPDKNKNISNEKFIKIKNAYDILSNNKLREQYDNQLYFKNKFNYNFNNGFNLFDINLKEYLSNFIDSTEINKIIKLILLKKELSNNLFNDGFFSNFNDFIKKLTNIEIQLEFNLKDIWECNPKVIKYSRLTRNIFEELIIPIDFIQIYEDEGEQIIINNTLYKGNLIIKINVINTFYGGENYYIYNNDLYILINNKRITNNKFIINFLDDNKYKFNLNKLYKETNKLGDVYYKKNFGLPKFTFNNIDKLNSNIKNIENNICYSNLFFIIILY